MLRCFWTRLWNGWRYFANRMRFHGISRLLFPLLRRRVRVRTVKYDWRSNIYALAVQDTEPKKETPETVQKKPTNSLGGNRLPIRTPASASSQGPRPKAPGLQPASLSSEISNLQLESLDISDQGEDLTCSSDEIGRAVV